MSTPSPFADDPSYGGLLALVDVDVSDFPVFWAELPLSADVPDAAAWAAGAASAMAQDRHIDDRATVAHLQALLQSVVGQPTEFERPLRLLFMPHPDMGGVLWEVVFASPDGDREATARRLVAANSPGDLGIDVQQYTHDGLTVLQCLRFFDEAVDVAAGGDVPAPRAIVTAAAVTVRREVGRFGVVDVVAFAGTANLNGLAMSLEPLRILLASGSLAALADGD